MTAPEAVCQEKFDFVGCGRICQYAANRLSELLLRLNQAGKESCKILFFFLIWLIYASFVFAVCLHVGRSSPRFCCVPVKPTAVTFSSNYRNWNCLILVVFVFFHFLFVLLTQFASNCHKYAGRGSISQGRKTLTKTQSGTQSVALRTSSCRSVDL
jgi:hypothetical protein